MEYSYSWNLIFISSWNNLSSLVAMMSIARCIAAGEQTRIDLSNKFISADQLSKVASVL